MSLSNCPICNRYPNIRKTVAGLFAIEYQALSCGLATRLYDNRSDAESVWEANCLQIKPTPPCLYSPFIGQIGTFGPGIDIFDSNKNPLPVDQTGEGEATKEDIFGKL